MLVVDSLFAELFGCVVCSPSGLNEVVGEDVDGKDLLELFTTTELGDLVLREGAAIPILGLEADDYRFLIIDESSEPSQLSVVRRASPGWVLHVQADGARLCCLGYLKRWSPNHPRHARLDLDAGWYQMTIVGGLDGGIPAFELRLRRREARPEFFAEQRAEFFDD